MKKLLLYPLILVAGLLVGLVLSDGSVWTLVAGAPDMGRADFSRADRPINETIACTQTAGCTSPDIALDAMTAPPESAMAVVDNLLTREGERVDDGSDPLHRRYVVRTTWLKFPDTMAIDAVPIEGGTALRISSRSQIGQSDFGVNEARIRRLVTDLGITASN